MVAEGYRRMLAAVSRKDLRVAVAALHGNTRRKLGPAWAAISDDVVVRITPIMKKIEAVLEGLSGALPDRHDAGKVGAGVPAGKGSDRHDNGTLSKRPSPAARAAVGSFP